MHQDFPEVDYVVCPVCARFRVVHKVYHLSTSSGMKWHSDDPPGPVKREFRCSYDHTFVTVGDLVHPDSNMLPGRPKVEHDYEGTPAPAPKPRPARYLPFGQSYPAHPGQRQMSEEEERDLDEIREHYRRQQHGPEKSIGE